MSVRYIKINWVLRTAQPDAKLYTIAANPQQRQVARRFYNESSAGGATVAASAAHPPLVDLHGRRHNYLRISLTERCNLRCKYCMPAEGVPLSARAALLSRPELARLVRLFAGLGVDKVRLTGGEPTLRQDLADVVQEMSAVPGISTVAMTTNGLVLTRRLPALQRAGLTHLNVSLDSLQPHRYEAMARRPGLPRVLAGLDLALQLGYRPKINVVLIKGFNEDEVGDFVEYTRERDLEVRFIEYMPFGGNRWSEARLVPHAAAVAAARARAPSLAPARELATPHDTARVWRAAGYKGRVGFVSSLTRPFCGGCNRLRLTADGNLKVCLFGAAELSLRDAVRAGASDPDLRDMVRAALRRKLPQHAGQYLVRAGVTDPSLRDMVRAALRRKLPQHAGQYLVRAGVTDPSLRDMVRAGVTDPSLRDMVRAGVTDPSLRDMVRAGVTDPSLRDMVRAGVTDPSLRDMVRAGVTDPSLRDMVRAGVTDPSLRDMVRAGVTDPSLRDMVRAGVTDPPALLSETYDETEEGQHETSSIQ